MEFPITFQWWWCSLRSLVRRVALAPVGCDSGGGGLVLVYVLKWESNYY